MVWQLISASFQRELALCWRRPAQALQPLAFAMLIMLLIAFAVGPDASRLKLIAPGSVILVLVLASFLQLDQLFAGDLEDGSLDSLIASGQPLVPCLYGKLAAFWLQQLLICTTAVPLLMIGMQLPMALIPTIAVAAALLSLAQCCLGILGAALTVRLRSGALLLALLVLPQLVPLLIFAVGSLNATLNGDSSQQSLYFLAAITVVYATFAPLLASLALQSTAD